LRAFASLRGIKKFQNTNSKIQIVQSRNNVFGWNKKFQKQIPNLKSRNPEIAPLRVSASLREIKIPKHKFQNPNQPGKVSK
jgi:hypothetical protein